MTQNIHGATVAITGGTGSFGRAMTEYLLSRGVAGIHVLSRDEAKQDEMRRSLSDGRVTFFLASTAETLAKAVGMLFGNHDSEFSVIGVRYGERLHETLMSAEESAMADDQVDYVRVPLDPRSPEHALHFEEKDRKTATRAEYTSENKARPDIEETKQLFLTLPEVQQMAAAG